MNRELREFHRKHGFELDLEIPKEPDEDLLQLGYDLKDTSKEELEPALLAQKNGDPRHYRAHLLLEELGELLLALGNGSPVALADACGDLMYVVAGTLVTFGINPDFVFDEIHRSNMTKKVRDPNNPRMRDKGESYIAPDLESVIVRSREWERWNMEVSRGV